MKRLNIKKRSYLVLLFLAILSLLTIKLPEKYNYQTGSFFSFSNIVSADDEKDEKYEQDDDYKAPAAPVQQVVQPVDQVVTEPQTYKQTYKLPDQIVTSVIMENVTLVDTDRDGIPDINDPHPTVPEYMIAEDSDNDGIVDAYDIDIVQDENGDGIADNYQQVTE
jgi:hypothetical protein